MILWNSLILIFILKIQTEARDPKGPVFGIEPAARNEFLSINGTEIQCNADGWPYAYISWQTREGDAVRDIPGLRYISYYKSLVFPPFTTTDYNPEIHDTFYQCVANNSVGTIVSRNVHVRGVVKQTFNPQVKNFYVGRGDTAVLRCQIPTFVEKYVSVDSWIRSDGYVIKISDTNRSHTVLFTGEFLIYDIKHTDSDWSYRCQTRNRLTGEMTNSTKEAKIYVTEPSSSSLPRVILKKDEVSAEEGSEIQLPCVAEGNPAPTYSWMKAVNNVFWPVKEDTRIRLVQGTLNIRKVSGSDAGTYQCIIRNSIGERRIESILIVRAPLSVHLMAPTYIKSVGEDATFTCNITGYPVHTVSWKKDGKAIVPSNRVQLLSRDVLHISSLQDEDKGMFQCFVHNDADDAQGSAALMLPVPLQWTAEPENSTVVVGNTVQINCSAIGFPEPRFQWLKSPYEDKYTHVVKTYIPYESYYMETLVISDAKPEDAGEYYCIASNGFEIINKIFYIRVLVPPRFIYSAQEIVTREEDNVTLSCHAIGDVPITIIWKIANFNFGAKYDPRYMLYNISIKNGTISELHIFNTTRSDAGKYICVAVSDIGKDVAIIELQVRDIADTKSFEAPPDMTTQMTPANLAGTGVPFLKERIPPASTSRCGITLTFSNNTGAVHPCIARREHMTDMRWYTAEGLVTDVPGIRHVDNHGTLRFSPFNSKDFNKTIHHNTYQCVGTTIAGTTKIIIEICMIGVIGEIKSFEPPPLMTTQMTPAKMAVPPKFIFSDEGLITKEGQNQTLICHAIGDSPIRISWHKKNTIFEINPRYFFRYNSTKNETISELQIIHTTRSDEGKYTCAASNEMGIDTKYIYLDVIASYDPRDIKVQSGGAQSEKVKLKQANLDDQQHLQIPYITGIQNSTSYATDVKTYNSGNEGPISNKTFEPATETKTIEDARETVLPTTPKTQDTFQNDLNNLVFKRRGANSSFFSNSNFPLWISDIQGIDTRRGSNVTLECHVIGDPPITIYWLITNSNVEAKSHPRYFTRNNYIQYGTISELQIIHTTRSDDGEYACLASSTNLFAIVKTISLNVVDI